MRRAATAAVALAFAMLGADAAVAAQASVRAWTDPARPFFGDIFDYVVEVTVDEQRADAVRIEAATAPFTAPAEPRTTRSAGDGVVRIRVTQALACLSAACVPRAGARAVALPRARVSGLPGVAPFAPAVVHVRPRVPAAAVRAPNAVFRHPASLEEPTSRAPPWALTTGFLAVAALALVVPAVAVVSRRRRSVRRGPVDPVARAIDLLRESVRRPPNDRRRAASLAARVVAEPVLADDAARVAWSRRPPDEEAPGRLAERIERARGAAP